METEDMFVAPVRSLVDGLQDPQVLHNNMVVELETPIGPLRLLGTPYNLSKTPASVRTPPPTHGQHTNEVLGELGFTDAEVGDLRSAEAI